MHTVAEIIYLNMVTAYDNYTPTHTLYPPYDNKLRLALPGNIINMGLDN